MFNFEWPWLFWLLPLPWLVRALCPPIRHAHAALRTPFLEDFSGLEAKTRAAVLRKWPIMLAALAWTLLLCAGARPRWLGDPVEQAVSGRDLMLVVDLSGSMEVKDFMLHGSSVDRLTAAKWVAGQFIEQRVGDRVGLILFGDRPYLHVPLTFDRATVRRFLEESVIGMAGEKTAIGDAIGLAVKRLRDRDADAKVLVLMTDGANTAGALSPMKAAELAAAEGLKVYTIGIGADEWVIRDFFGTRRVNPSADLDEAMLQAIAEKTEGRYFRARDTQQLAEIYALLDRLEPAAEDVRYFRPSVPLYPWPLAAALALAVGLAVAQLRGKLGS